MNGKNCTLCVYRDGQRSDGSWKCTDPTRQRDESVKDCCIAEAPLRSLQASAKDADTYAHVTHDYVTATKHRSAYWRKRPDPE